MKKQIETAPKIIEIIVKSSPKLITSKKLFIIDGTTIRSIEAIKILYNN